MVTDAVSGQYHSVFKGRGMNFEDVREYVPGDEVRTIDWNVTARAGTPFVKRFTEEREMTLLLCVDVSASHFFGSQSESKKELAAEVAAVLAFSAIKNNDRVGLLLFTESVEKFIPPRKGRKHVLRVIREILFFEPVGKHTDVSGALAFARRILNRKAVVFIVSDFLCADFSKPLKQLGRQHDLIGVNITDPWENKIPALGLITFEDLETGGQIEVNSTSHRFQKQWTKRITDRNAHLKATFQTAGVDLVSLKTGESYLLRLIQLFEKRMLRRK